MPTDSKHTDLMQRDHAHLFVASREGVHGIQLDRGEAQVIPWALYGNYVRCLHVDEKGVLLAAGLREGGVRRTANAGKTWQPAVGLESGEARVMSGTGPVVYCGTGDARLFRSQDGGATFTAVSGFGDAWRDSWTAVSGSTPRVSAILARGSRVVVGVAAGGVLVSDGADFRRVSDGLPAAVLSLAAPKGDDALVLAGTTEGLFRTSKLGQSPWEPMFKPRQRYAITALAFSPTGSETILCGASRALDLAKPALPEGADAAVFRSDDGGKSFTPVRIQLPVLRGIVTAIVFPRSNPEAVFLGTSAGEIFDSIDGGRSFRLCAATLPGVLDLVPGNSGWA